MKLVNERDVARMANVSQSTVSRVMTSDPRISSDTQRKVLAAARELGYDMRSATGRWSVGVLIGYRPGDANGYYTGIFNAVFQELERRGLRMEPIWRTLTAEVRPIRGLLVLSHPPPETLAAAYPLPVVRLNGPSSHLHNICSVNQDSYKGSEMAVRHLRQLGHRDIRYVSLEGVERETRKTTGRWQGFLEAMRELGCPAPERQGIFFSGLGGTPQDQLTEAIRRAVRQGCTALICVNSQYTLKVNAALHSLGIRVPEELSVIDWEFEGVSECLDPPRTTIAADYPKLAAEAMDLLCEMIEQHKTPPDRMVMPHLILRQSTAAANHSGKGKKQ